MGRRHSEVSRGPRPNPALRGMIYAASSFGNCPLREARPFCENLRCFYYCDSGGYQLGRGGSLVWLAVLAALAVLVELVTGQESKTPGGARPVFNW